MIDKRFSSEAFSRLVPYGFESMESAQLANELEREIQRGMHRIAWPLFNMCILRLNAFGHGLKLYEDPRPGDYAFRDDEGGEDDYRCKLRVGFDGLAMAGYAEMGVCGDESESIGSVPATSGEPWTRLGALNEKFSRESFTSSGLDTSAARERSDNLAEAIMQELHTALWPAFKMLIVTLNSLGHDLRPYTDVKPGSYEFRDAIGHGVDYKCMLSVAFDYLVCTGYSHLRDPDDDEDE